MENGRFTFEEEAYLVGLDAVDAVDGSSVIRWNAKFRNEFLRRHAAGESPSAIFRDAGVGPEVIGRKRLERCSERWRAYERERRMEGPAARQPWGWRSVRLIIQVRQILTADDRFQYICSLFVV